MSFLVSCKQSSKIRCGFHKLGRDLEVKCSVASVEGKSFQAILVQTGYRDRVPVGRPCFR